MKYMGMIIAVLLIGFFLFSSIGCLPCAGRDDEYSTFEDCDQMPDVGDTDL